MTADSLVRVQEVVQRTGLSKSTIYRMIARDEFPKQTTIGRQIVVWRRTDIEEWIASPTSWSSAA